MAPTYPGGMYYYIQWPGKNASAARFFAYKCLPNDASGTTNPPSNNVGILPSGAIGIGDYGSIDAAQAACDTDANPSGSRSTLGPGVNQTIRDSLYQLSPPVPGTAVPEAPLDGGLYGRQNSAWTVIGQLAAPVAVSLPETVFTILDTWYDVLPPVTLNLPRSGNSIIQINLSLHLTWTANTGVLGLCDWSVDAGTHLQRTLHAVVDKTDDSSVNGVDCTFWAVVSGLTPSVGIKGRQHKGPIGMLVVGTQTTAWPALQSYALIIDCGKG